MQMDSPEVYVFLYTLPYIASNRQVGIFFCKIDDKSIKNKIKVNEPACSDNRIINSCFCPIVP